MTLALFRLHQAADFAVWHSAQRKPIFQPRDLLPLIDFDWPHSGQRNVRNMVPRIFSWLSVASRKDSMWHGSAE